MQAVEEFSFRARGITVATQVVWGSEATTNQDKVKGLRFEVQIGPVAARITQFLQAAAQPSDETYACSRTVKVSCSCLSGE